MKLFFKNLENLTLCRNMHRLILSYAYRTTKSWLLKPRLKAAFTRHLQNSFSSTEFAPINRIDTFYKTYFNIFSNLCKGPFTVGLPFKT